MWHCTVLAVVLLPLSAGAPAESNSLPHTDYVAEIHRYLDELLSSNHAKALDGLSQQLEAIQAQSKALPREDNEQTAAVASDPGLDFHTQQPAGSSTPLYADPAAFARGGPGAPTKFRVVVTSPVAAPREEASVRAKSNPASTEAKAEEPLPTSVNPFDFEFADQQLRFRPSKGLCASHQNGNVVLAACEDSVAKWALNGDKVVLDADSNQCLSVREGRVGEGADAVLMHCNHPHASAWLVDSGRLRAAANNDLCLSVSPGPVVAGSRLQLFICDQAANVADWVVVGGGASGCAAAAALVDAGESVIVLERGSSDTEISETQQAQTWPRVVNTDAAETIRWTDGTWGAVAKVLGGGTAINGGLYIEEEPSYFTDALGSDVDLAALYASSRYIAANLTKPLQPSNYGRDFAKALQEVGLSANGEPHPQVRWSEGSWVAFSTIDTSQPGRWPRRSAAVLLHERAGLPNLEVMTEYLASQVIFQGNRATGVMVSWRGYGHGFLVPARKGVILAAGAIYTPQLLQVSGIGEAALLNSLGVDVVSDLPVGRNFIDRPVCTVGVWSGIDLPLHVGYAVDVDTQQNITAESEAGGSVASEFTIASLAFSPPADRNELLRLTFKLLFATPIADLLNNMMQLVALQHRPKSRGQVQAVSRVVSVPPQVTANHLADQADLTAQLAALNKLLAIAASSALQPYARPKLWTPPGLPVPSFLSCFMNSPGERTSGIVFPCLPAPDAALQAWVDFVRNTVVSSYHYFGTASMGSVVEGPDFLVKGTANLHVVDASVLPLPTSVNPQGTIMAVGHYAGKRIAALGGRRLAALDGAAAAQGEVHV